MVTSSPELIIVNHDLSLQSTPSPIAAVISAPLLLPRGSLNSSAWRGILLVEPNITLLMAQALLLTRLDYCVTPAFSHSEIFALRDTKPIALAILSDRLGPRILASVARTVRKQWPLARILILGRPEFVLEDHLYDEEISHSSDPRTLIEDIERLYKDLWNQRSHTLNWDVKRSGPCAARSMGRECGPTRSLTPDTMNQAIDISLLASGIGQHKHIGQHTDRSPNSTRL